MGISTTASQFNSALGKMVHRTTAADPQNVWLPLFTITGMVIFTGLMARRTVIQAGGASTMQFRHSAVPTILDDGTLAITGDVADTVYSCDFDPTDPIISAVGTVPGAIAPFGLTVDGDIEVTMTAVAGTGSMEYWVAYIPVNGGYVVAV